MQTADKEGGSARMSVFHCSCGFAIDHAEEFADHFHQVFAPDDDIGTDGRTHYELTNASLPKPKCACGFQASDMSELDDHLLIVFIPQDSMGSDDERHLPVDTSTPIRWHVRRAIDD
jgi:hypothetical protein